VRARLSCASVPTLDGTVGNPFRSVTGGVGELAACGVDTADPGVGRGGCPDPVVVVLLTHSLDITAPRCSADGEARASQRPQFHALSLCCGGVRVRSEPASEDRRQLLFISSEMAALVVSSGVAVQLARRSRAACEGDPASAVYTAIVKPGSAVSSSVS